MRSPDGVIQIERWPRGARNQIDVPEHTGGLRGDALIVATFHTHPNPGTDFQQEPGLTDIRSVRNDPDLRHSEYEGEFVISTEQVYLIRPDGSVEVVGATSQVLQLD